MRRVLGGMLITAGLAATGVGLLAGHASAHHPIISGTTECRSSVDGPWIVQWTIANSESEPDRPMTEHSAVLSGGSWIVDPSPNVVPPGGSVFASSTQDASTAAVTLTYNASWTYGGGSVGAERTAIVYRPDVCEGVTTTSTSTTSTTSTTSSTTSTTSSTTTSTSVPESTSTTSTVVDPSTTSSSSSTSTTSTLLASGGPTTTSTVPSSTTTSGGGQSGTPGVASGGPVPSSGGASATAASLPATGFGAEKIAMLGAFLILLGCVTLLLGQRPAARSQRA